MRLGVVCVLLALVSQLAAQSTRLDLISGASTFSVHTPDGTRPYFTLNGNNYPVLATLDCADGLQPVYSTSSSSWTCDTFTGYSGAGTAGALGCAEGEQFRWTGTVWECTKGNLNAELGCDVGQTVKNISGSWACANDSNTIDTLGCPVESFLKWDGSAWVCDAGADTLPTITGCSDAQLLRYDGSAWACSDDLNTFLEQNCSDGQLLKWNGTAFDCAADNNALASLSCDAYDTIINNGTLQCVPQPINSLSPPVLLVDGQSLPPSTQTIKAASFGSASANRLSIPIQYLGGFSIIGWSLAISGDPRTWTPPDSNFTLAMEIKNKNGTILDVFDLGTGTTNYGSVQRTFPGDMEGVHVYYRYGGLKFTNVTVTSTLLLKVTDYYD